MVACTAPTRDQFETEQAQRIALAEGALQLAAGVKTAMDGQIAELQKENARLRDQIALLLGPLDTVGHTEEQWREIEKHHAAMSQTAKEQGE